MSLGIGARAGVAATLSCACLAWAVPSPAAPQAAAPQPAAPQPAAPQAAAPGPPKLAARAFALISADTGQPLVGHDSDRELPIASATKLMTALLTLEHVPNLDRTFSQNDFQAASVDSQIGLTPGERMSVRDLLRALLLPSADDAAEDLAFNVGSHSVSRFVAMMNARAAALGLSHTHYSTPSGLDTPGNYSSASDLTRLARFLLLHHPFFRRTVALAHTVLRTGSHVRVVDNRNDLVGRVPWVSGVKTGHTLGAGYVLVASGTRAGMTLVSAVLGTDSQATRDAVTLALLSYGFANFHLAAPVRAGEALASPTVKYRAGAHVKLVASRSFKWVIGRGSTLTTRVVAPRQLSGPLSRRSAHGQMIVFEDGRPIARIPLLLAQRLPAVSLLTIAAQFLIRPTTLLLLLALLASAIGVWWHRRERAQRRESARLRAA